MATRRDSKGRFLKSEAIEEAEGQIAVVENNSSLEEQVRGDSDGSQVNVEKHDVNLGHQKGSKSTKKAKGKKKSSATKVGKKNSGGGRSTKDEPVAEKEDAPEADPDSDVVDELERSFEIKLRKGNVADLERFLRKAASNPSGELGRREGRILTVMLKHAYKGSAQHAKLCLDWCKAPAQSKEKEPTQSVAEVLFEKLGFEKQ